ncbi:MAG: hypothetical protein ACRDDH_18895, partial [Cetobacterium sp.]
MSKLLRKNWHIYIILLTFISTKINAQVVEPPNAYDEYEIVDTQMTQSLDVKSWSDSEENIRGVEFQNLELNTDLSKTDILPEGEKLIYKGRAFLENRRGVIYSIVDPIAIDPRLNILTDNYALIDSSGKIKEPITFYGYT